MGNVYRADRDGEAVALKVIKRDLASDAQYRQRFLHEARAAATVVHPHLVSVIDAGEVGGRQFLVMPLVQGRTLSARITAEGPLAPADVATLVSEIGSALDALHAAGLAHRDVKPANILLREQGGSALTDFGLAKGDTYDDLTVEGQVVGSLDYLAPERIRGEAAVPASDVYSLGCVAFESLTGRPPFGGLGMVKTLFGHLEEQPPDPAAERPDVTAAFARALLAALAKDPAQRPASGAAYAQMLADALG